MPLLFACTPDIHLNLTSQTDVRILSGIQNPRESLISQIGNLLKRSPLLEKHSMNIPFHPAQQWLKKQQRYSLHPHSVFNLPQILRFISWTKPVYHNLFSTSHNT